MIVKLTVNFKTPDSKRKKSCFKAQKQRNIFICFLEQQQEVSIKKGEQIL